MSQPLSIENEMDGACQATLQFHLLSGPHLMVAIKTR